ncbi:MAG TPA: SCE4755 family polysaccharide monooxygenase-like protein [Bryobacteraceae bacterium]|jgi:hypothetical protein|nr:SCE4755 family polysaccharide monooxygenase-like protein [Bryobacteraceae bacterium]
MKALGIVLSCLIAAALLAPFAEGHFRLLYPQSWVIENDLGNPQKPGPCGGTEGDSGISPTNAITKIQGGQNLHIKVMEVVYHPGHYRIALVVNSRADLPEDPVVVTRDTDQGPRSVSAKIDANPTAPVLADGLWVHTARSTAPFETDVQLPNIDCPACILQIVEFMAEHAYNKPGGYSYHHCAVLNITADPSEPIDGRWPKPR